MPNMKNWKKPKQPKANWTRVPGSFVPSRTESRTRVRARSKRMESKMAQYRKLKDEFLRAFPNCQCGGCRNASQEIHHARGRVGSLLLDWRYWLALYRSCHRWLGDNPVKARSHGLLCAEGQWNVPDRTPIPRFER